MTFRKIRASRFSNSRICTIGTLYAPWKTSLHLRAISTATCSKYSTTFTTKNSCASLAMSSVATGAKTMRVISIPQSASLTSSWHHTKSMAHSMETCLSRSREISVRLYHGVFNLALTYLLIRWLSILPWCINWPTASNYTLLAQSIQITGCEPFLALSMNSARKLKWQSNTWRTSKTSLNSVILWSSYSSSIRAMCLKCLCMVTLTKITSADNW